MDKFIPSLITPGKHFSVSVYKPQHGPAYATTTEGTRGDPSPHGFTSFSYEIPGARMHRVTLDGRNTPKNRHIALTKLIADMVEHGWVSPEDAANFDIYSVA